MDKYFIQRKSDLFEEWQDATFHGQANALDGFDTLKELLIAVHDGNFQAGLNIQGVKYRIIKRHSITQWEDEVIVE